MIVCLFLDFSWFWQNLCFLPNFFLRGSFWEFWNHGKQTNSRKFFFNCRKNYVLKIYILTGKYVLKSKMNVIFVLKVCGAFLRKLHNRPQVWPFTLKTHTKIKNKVWNVYLSFSFFSKFPISKYNATNPKIKRKVKKT